MGVTVSVSRTRHRPRQDLREPKHESLYPSCRKACGWDQTYALRALLRPYDFRSYGCDVAVGYRSGACGIPVTRGGHVSTRWFGATSFSAKSFSTKWCDTGCIGIGCAAGCDRRDSNRARQPRRKDVVFAVRDLGITVAGRIVGRTANAIGTEPVLEHSQRLVQSYDRPVSAGTRCEGAAHPGR